MTMPLQPQAQDLHWYNNMISPYLPNNNGIPPPVGIDPFEVSKYANSSGMELLAEIFALLEATNRPVKQVWVNFFNNYNRSNVSITTRP